MTHTPSSFPIGIFLLSWTVVISYPLFIYSWMKFNKHHRQVYFQKRKVSLILLQTIIMFISICIGAPIKILHFDMDLLSLSPLIGLIIKSMLEGPVLLSITMIICIRIWALNFDHKLQLEMCDISWKSQLSSFSVDSTSFYTKYKNTLGSLAWSCKIFASLYILLCILFITNDFSNNNVLHIFASVLLITAFIVTWTIIIIIWIKYPTFKDRFFIREELKESIIYIITISIVAAILLFFISWKRISQFVEIFLMDGLCYICILRVIKLNMYKKNSTNVAKLAASMDNNPLNFTMNTILANKYGFAEFMNFLKQEFASESLCFATEYSQFRESLNLNDKQKTLMGCNIIFKTAFSNRKSQFQCNTQLDCHQFISIIRKLYEKYIAFDTATYEINVSYSARLSLAMLIDNKYKQCAENTDLQNLKTNNFAKNNLPQTIQIVIPILEVILFEIIRLLQHSFSRFKKSAIWNELCNQIINDTGLHTMKTISTTQKQRSSALFGVITRQILKNESPTDMNTDLDFVGVTSAEIYNSLSNASSPSPVPPVTPDNLMPENEANIIIDLMKVPVVSKDDVFVE